MADQPRTIDVSLGARSYQIRIASGSLDEAASWMLACRPFSHAALITDHHVRSYGQRVLDSLQQVGVRTEFVDVPPGERSKSVAMADRLWTQLLEVGADRKSVVVAVGGGVLGDLAGFVAATYARGIDYFQVPTTLLAQVDSSVGGKVAVNLPGAKNMVGAFWQPRGVSIDPDVLATLPVREYRAGLAEVVKYGVILDEEFFGFLEREVEAVERREPGVLTEIIARCCRLKADIVEQDECELTGVRAVLNYGHTFAHGLEAVTDYQQLLHGEAVAMGMVCAARLASHLGRVDRQLVARQENLLAALGLPCRPPPVDRAAWLEAMRYDKKAEHGRLRFILPNRIGQVEMVADVDPYLVQVVLDE